MNDYLRIEKVIHHLEKHYLQQPSLEDLAKVAGVSEFHFHRLFTQWAGLTPKDFLKFLTANHAKALLHQSRNLLATSLESGLSGPGRLHDLLVTVEAVTPGEYKSKGRGVVIDYGFHESPFGTILLGVTKRGVCFLSFTHDPQELRSKWANAELRPNQESTLEVAKKLFATVPCKQLSVLLMGTSFQIKVWEALLSIPDGQVLSYSDVAKLVNSPKAARAVGSAVGSNAIAYLIPCHRVIRESGHFSDYRWDPARKKAMLAWESSHHVSSLR
ncbi:MAG TPA: methylated-DNA--[protein]-cysteine S-methyltransferase [Bacteriovoracaceae bacterium]|nr:methylated-DNA--[protein]-cysteine S-methyltransferase [Bacteriovoracaceae bacterium]